MEGRAFGSSLVSIRPRKWMSVRYPLQRSTMLLWPKKAQTRSQSLWHVTRSSVSRRQHVVNPKFRPGMQCFSSLALTCLGFYRVALKCDNYRANGLAEVAVRDAETVSNSQNRGGNEGRSENPRRSPSAQLTATIRRSGEFQEKNWSRWQTGRSTKHRAEVVKTSCTIWGERVVPESWTRAPMRQE